MFFHIHSGGKKVKIIIILIVNYFILQILNNQQFVIVLIIYTYSHSLSTNDVDYHCWPLMSFVVSCQSVGKLKIVGTNTAVNCIKYYITGLFMQVRTFKFCKICFSTIVLVKMNGLMIQNNNLPKNFWIILLISKPATTNKLIINIRNNK